MPDSRPEAENHRRTETPPGSAASTDTARLETAMANAGIGTFDWDLRTDRIEWDEPMSRLFGLDPDDFDGRMETFMRAVHPEDLPSVADAVKQVKRTGVAQITYRMYRSDGMLRWYTSSGRVVRDETGRPERMLGVTQDRTDEYQREARKQDRRDFVLDLTRRLTASPTTDDIVHAVMQTALPGLETSAMVMYLAEESGRLRLIGWQGYDAENEQRLRGRAEQSTTHPFVGDFRRGEPLFLESRREYLRRMPEAIPPAGGQHAWALLPLLSADGFIGLWVLVYDRPRRFTPDDRTVLTAAAGILGQSLARARLFDTRRQYLTELQRLMLPRLLPPISGLEVAVRYLPGSEGLQVGGDWYDALSLPDDRVALVIGDVQGHSARAAAVMGQLRTAMHTQAQDGHVLEDLLAGANRTLYELDTDLLATCCIAEVHPASGRLRLARAGHPYPLCVEPDGRVTEWDVPGGLPLGVLPEEDYPITEAELPRGTALLLFTDGLVESPEGDYAHDLAEQIERLSLLVGAAPEGTPPLEHLVDRIVAPANARPQHDDIAVMLVRRPPA